MKASRSLVLSTWNFAAIFGGIFGFLDRKPGIRLWAELLEKNNHVSRSQSGQGREEHRGILNGRLTSKHFQHFAIPIRQVGGLKPPEA
jgi:hypothetical protein